MSHQVKLNAAPSSVRRERVSHHRYRAEALASVKRIVERAAPATRHRLAPVRLDGQAESDPHAAADKKSLDAVGVAFTLATAIVWVIAILLVRGAAP